MLDVIRLLPIASTLVAAGFTRVLYLRWREAPGKRHLLWWMIGVALFGVGTATEAIVGIAGWSEPVFRAWYISGALLGGAPLAQGTVYLMVSRDRADRLTVAMLSYASIAAVFVLLTPIAFDLVDPDRLSSRVIVWSWVRLFSPLLNTYALVFLVGGAIVSAVRYRRRGGSGARVKGNVLIAAGALLPGIGGSFTRLGYVEVLFVMELVGLVLLWAGYRAIAADESPSIHAAVPAA